MLPSPKLFAEDCVLNFAGNPSIIGISRSKDFFSSKFLLLMNMRHTIKRVYVLLDRIYQESGIRYVVKGDPGPKENLIKDIALWEEAWSEIGLLYRLY